MKTITPLFILMFASSLIAQVENIGVTKVLFFGDKSSKLYYSAECGGRSDISTANFIVFTNTDIPPEKQGFTLSTKCPGGRTKPSSIAPLVVLLDKPPKFENPSLAMIASDFRTYKGRLLARNVLISIETESWGPNGYGRAYSAFRIRDGSASELVYARRDSRTTKALRADISQSDGSIKVRVLHRPRRQHRLISLVFGDLVDYTILND